MLTRRALAASALPVAAARADAPPPGDVLLACLSDLHSAQGGAAATLAALDAALAAHAGEAAILVNGDVFERGNAVALRSGGAADWAFLAALRRRAPVVLNLGNHETALLDDMAEAVRRARALDVAVVSNLRDRRTGAPFAEPALDLPLRGGRRMRVVGVATDEILTYRAPIRPSLDIPAPAGWARENLPGLLAGADLAVVMSHAGVLADQEILPLLPPGSLLLGGHEHLDFAHAEGATRLLHTGSWNRVFRLAGIAFGAGAPRIGLRRVAPDPAGPGQREDAAHAALWRDVRAAFERPEDREVVLRLPAPLPLGAGARRAAAAIAAATGARAGFIAHTSFGTGLPEGDVTRLDWDAFLRFDGALFRAGAGAAELAAMAPRLNQDDDRPLAARTGDFAYADPWPVAAGPVASNGWVRLNAPRYLGMEAALFAEVPELRLKPVVAEALRRG